MVYINIESSEIINLKTNNSLFLKNGLINNFIENLIKKNKSKLVFMPSISFKNNLFRYKNFYKNNHFKFFFKYNKNYYYIFNNTNIIHFQQFTNNFFSNNKNSLIIDSEYKNILPLYNFIYGSKNLYADKSFFFMSKKNITSPSWIYFYKKFIKKYEIALLIFLDYPNYVKFFKYFIKTDVALFSIITQNYSSAYLDYYIYSLNYNIELNSLIFLNYFSYIYFYKNNYKIFLLKNKIFLYFNKYFN